MWLNYVKQTKNKKVSINAKRFLTKGKEKLFECSCIYTFSHKHECTYKYKQMSVQIRKFNFIKL